MSRYVDTKWLEDNAKEYSLGYYEEDEWATPLNVLDSAPSIDICLCRECKHWNKAPNTERGWCDKCDGLVEPNFYCADGEEERIDAIDRKESE